MGGRGVLLGVLELLGVIYKRVLLLAVYITNILARSVPNDLCYGQVFGMLWEVGHCFDV